MIEREIEKWYPIAGYENEYMVSNLGKVKSLVRPIRSLYGEKKKTTERILKPYVVLSGYEQVTLSKNGLFRNVRVHKLVADAFVANPGRNSIINHKDGNKRNNRADNLEWCTQSRNVIHAYETGLIGAPKPDALEDTKRIIEEEVKAWDNGLTLPEEKWVDVAGSNGRYKISNLGRVKIIGQVLMCGYGFKYKRPNTLAKLITKKNGYLEVKTSNNGHRKAILVHRLVATHFLPNPFNLPQVNHKDSDKTNNRSDNLEWCTASHNVRHSFGTGTRTVNKSLGENAGSTRLTNKEVLAIRHYYETHKISMRGIGRMFGLTPSTARGIIKRIYWSHI